MKVYIHYETTEEPWGGLNSFFKSFRNYLKGKNSKDVKLIENISDDFDIFIMGACSCGQNNYIDYKMIKRLLRSRESFWYRVLAKRKKNFKIIHRLDGLRMFYNNRYDPSDDLQIKLSQLADFIIFQSEYSLDTFRKVGYKKNNFTIINNGVNQRLFNLDSKRFWKKNGKLKVLSSNWSDNPNKGYATIAAFSDSYDGEFSFVGNWPKEIDSRKVNIYPPMHHEDLSKFFKQHDVFLHAAQNDPCPNVVLEAMSCGLPVIFHDSGGTKEIAHEFGVRLEGDVSRECINRIMLKMEDNYDNYIENLIKNHNRFSIEYVAEKYLETFNKLING